ALGRALLFGLAVSALWVARYLAWSMMTDSSRPLRTAVRAAVLVLVIGLVVWGQRTVQDVIDPGDPLTGGAAYAVVGRLSAQEATTRAIVVILVLGVAVGDGLVKGWRARPSRTMSVPRASHLREQEHTDV